MVENGTLSLDESWAKTMLALLWLEWLDVSYRKKKEALLVWTGQVHNLATQRLDWVNLTMEMSHSLWTLAHFAAFAPCNLFDRALNASRHALNYHLVHVFAQKKNPFFS